MSGNFSAFDTLRIFGSADKKLCNSVISTKIIKIHISNKWRSYFFLNEKKIEATELPALPKS